MAADMASRVGLQGLTIGGLAKVAGMSKSGLFAQVTSKDQLQLSVLNLASDNFTQIVFLPAFKKPRGIPRIEAILNNWVKYLEDQQTFSGARILISASTELADQPGDQRDFMKKVLNDLLASVARAVAYCQRRRAFSCRARRQAICLESLCTGRWPPSLQPHAGR